MRLRVPDGPGVRDDSGAYEGGEVSIFYDPLVSKLITWGDTRFQALARMRRALAEYEVRGIQTTIPFFQWLLEDSDFLDGRFDTSFIDRKLASRNGKPFREAGAEEQELAAIAVAVSRVLQPSPEHRADRPRSRWKDGGRFDGLRP